MPVGLELLAPARDAATAREAILHGADAIYIGGPSHGARAAASNSVADIAGIADMAHRFGVRVYVTLNTIIYDSELSMVERTVRELYRAGVDALIVQDMALLRLDLPPIDLHASTQCDIRTPEKARFLADCGFSQLVLPRELSADDIRAYRRAVHADVSLEAFVHGALCVSYSGDCQASYAACGRSANRGECAQMCRLPHSLTDADGNVLIADKHLLSLRDLNRLADLHTLADAGITSFKIEGRLKDVSYVKTVTAAYRQALDRLIADHPDRYCRTSMGVSDIRFEPDVSKAFNRGFTSYFLQGTPRRAGFQPAPETRECMANFDTPKFIGEKVATVVSCHRGVITARINRPLANGDGLGYFTPAGRYAGFRANRVEANRIYPASKVQIEPGTTLYRNSDTAYEALMAGDTATRKIPVDITLTGQAPTQERLLVTIRLTDDYGHMAESTIETENTQARTPQTDARRRTLAKLGDTDFALRDIDDRLDADTFVPLSTLTVLRRSATDTLAADIAATYPYRYRRPENPEARGPESLTYHDNVANRLAADFYADHSPKVGRLPACANSAKEGRLPACGNKERDGAGFHHALELQKRVPEGTVVMTTRYCLRRELGACLLTPEGRSLPSPLYLQNPSGRYRLDFDCAHCQMQVTVNSEQ